MKSKEKLKTFEISFRIVCRCHVSFCYSKALDSFKMFTWRIVNIMVENIIENLHIQLSWTCSICWERDQIVGRNRILKIQLYMNELRHHADFKEWGRDLFNIRRVSEIYVVVENCKEIYDGDMGDIFILFGKRNFQFLLFNRGKALSWLLINFKAIQSWITHFTPNLINMTWVLRW